MTSTTQDMQLGLFGDPTPYTPPAPRRTRTPRPEQLALFAAGNATPAGQFNGQTSALDLLDTAPTEAPTRPTCAVCGRTLHRDSHGEWTDGFGYLSFVVRQHTHRPA